MALAQQSNDSSNLEDTMESGGSHVDSSDAMSGPTIYSKRTDVMDPEDNFWDDTALIKAYDKAVSLTYDAVKNGGSTSKPSKANAKSGQSSALKSETTNDVKAEDFRFRVPQQPLTVNTNTKSSKKSKTKFCFHKWEVGDECEALYVEDDVREYYPAKILQCTGSKCKVEFDGYEGQVHTLPYSQIRQSTSRDVESSQDSAMGEDMGCPIPVLPPPPTLKWMKTGAPSHQEAMSSMLMSWYMNGYHTGYYQAMCEMEEQKGSKRDRRRRKDSHSSRTNQN